MDLRGRSSRESYGKIKATVQMLDKGHASKHSTVQANDAYMQTEGRSSLNYNVYQTEYMIKFIKILFSNASIAWSEKSSCMFYTYLSWAFKILDLSFSGSRHIKGDK